MSRILKIISIFTVLVGILLPANSYAASTGSKFVTCDIDGVQTGTFFTKTTIAVSDIDTSGNYTYYGVDVGVFKKPEVTELDPAAKE